MGTGLGAILGGGKGTAWGAGIGVAVGSDARNMANNAFAGIDASLKKRYDSLTSEEKIEIN